MANAVADSPPNFEILLDIPVNLSVELGSCNLSMQEVLQLGVGSVVQLDKTADAPVELFVNRKLVARGEVVVVDDRFGIKVTEIVGKQG
jgi:flagellar motor switch protein FliN/FliY